MRNIIIVLLSCLFLLLLLLLLSLSWTNSSRQQQQQNESHRSIFFVESFQVPPPPSQHQQHDDLKRRRGFFTTPPPTTATAVTTISSSRNNWLWWNNNNNNNNNNDAVTKCYGNIQFTTTNNNNNTNNNQDDVEEKVTMKKQKQSTLSTDLEKFLVVFGPAIMFTLSFTFYENTELIFHNLVQLAARNNFIIVDGSKTLTEELLPALNGPVATSVAILFGTLTSMTISNLYNRQVKLAILYEDTLEEIRILKIHFDRFPTTTTTTTNNNNIENTNDEAVAVTTTKDYRKLSKYKIDEYKARLMSFLNGTSPKTMQGRRKLEEIMILLHELTQEDSILSQVNGRILDEAYGSLNRIFKLRSDLTTTYENQFPIWHYGNLGLLGTSILTIFLVETDKPALQFLGGFQLKLCWAILIGTYSMLASVIYDLATPYTGSYQIVIPIEEKASDDDDDDDDDDENNNPIGSTASTE